MSICGADEVICAHCDCHVAMGSMLILAFIGAEHLMVNGLNGLLSSCQFGIGLRR